MVRSLQLTLFTAAVTPEDVCIRGDAPGWTERRRTVRLQLSVVLTSAPRTHRRLRDVVALDEEEFGFAGQAGAGVGGEQTSDGVQVQSGPVTLGGQQMRRATAAADHTADERTRAEVISPMGDVHQNRHHVSRARRPAFHHVET